MEKFVITISRGAGSGGSTLGKKLAEHYGINYYDKEILRLASDDSGINEALFARADEKVKRTTLFQVSRKVYNGELIPPASGNFTSDRNLFNYQAKVLKELAEQESYVVIGRAADFILKDRPNVFRIFIYAEEDFCVAHEAERLCISHEDAAARIKKLNKERNEFHKFYTGRSRDDCRNYDLCLNTGVIGIEGCVELVCRYIEMKLKEA
jgi:cytidylate kinase